MTSEVLGLVQLGAGLDFPLETLTEPLSSRFKDLEVRVADRLDDPAEAYDSRRDQYHSTRIVAMLEEHLHLTQFDRLLGVASFDLYVPQMNFVFGEARLPGRAGVISTHRLRPKERDDIALLQERAAKEAVHETGHMMGLKHCDKTFCVMHFSNSLADTDLKKPDFCQDCELRLKVGA